MSCKNCTSSLHERLERLGLAQYGVITTAQATSRGLSSQYLARSPRWERVTPGVYRLAALSQTWHQSLMVAVLAGGPGTVVSHRSAAILQRLDGLRGEIVEVTIPRERNHRNVEGVVVHRSAHLPPIDRHRPERIPATTVTRTLVDLASVVDADTLEIAIESGLRSHRTSLPLLQRRLKAVGGKGRAGSASLKAIVNGPVDQAPTESVLETRFVQLCRRFDIPPGNRQYKIAGDTGLLRADFAWPERRVLVELEGYAWHGTRADHREDMRRQNVILLTHPGWTILRYGWADVVDGPARVAAELGCALRPPAPQGSSAPVLAQKRLKPSMG